MTYTKSEYKLCKKMNKFQNKILKYTMVFEKIFL